MFSCRSAGLCREWVRLMSTEGVTLLQSLVHFRGFVSNTNQQPMHTVLFWNLSKVSVLSFLSCTVLLESGVINFCLLRQILCRFLFLSVVKIILPACWPSSLSARKLKHTKCLVSNLKICWFCFGHKPVPMEPEYAHVCSGVPLAALQCHLSAFFTRPRVCKIEHTTPAIVSTASTPKRGEWSSMSIPYLQRHSSWNSSIILL